MTIQKAIEVLEYARNYDGMDYGAPSIALDMAISALRQQEHFREVTKKVGTLTNAQKIRAMSDEEMAEYVCRNSINTLCDIICGGECNAIATLKRTGDFVCKEIVKKWLQQTAEDDDHGV